MRTSQLNSFFIEDGNLAIYLKDISRYAPLTGDQEYETAERIHQGDEKALRQLVKANLRFVVSVARNYQHQGMSLSDLINAGNLGLIRAAQRFNHKKNFKFISYAVWWIRQSILQSLAEQSRIVKVPINRTLHIHRVGKTRAKLEQKYHRLPNNEEVARELGIRNEDVATSIRISAGHASLDAPLQKGKTDTLISIMADTNQENPDECISRISLHREVEELLNNLSTREQEVVALYFGIGEATNYTLEEIGLRLDLTRERVRQIKERALRKLRRYKKGLAA